MSPSGGPAAPGDAAPDWAAWARALQDRLWPRLADPHAPAGPGGAGGGGGVKADGPGGAPGRPGSGAGGPARAPAGVAGLDGAAAPGSDPARPPGPSAVGTLGAWPAAAAALGLDQPLPEQRLPEDALARRWAALQDALFAAQPAPGEPRLLAHVSPALAPAALLGAQLAAGLQANLGLRRMARLPLAIETQLLAWLGQLLGAPQLGRGLLLGGGSAAGQTAVWAALARAVPGWAEHGLAAAPRPLVAYASEACHGWLDRALRLAGLGRAALRRLPVDAGQRLRPEALQAALAEDRRAGRQPWLLVATVGSVGAGAVDPLDRLAPLARAEGLWLHVDGAHGALAASLLADPALAGAHLRPETAAALAALGQADSLMLDTAKALQGPVGAAALLLREPAALDAAFGDAPPPYYAEAEDAPPDADPGPGLPHADAQADAIACADVHVNEHDRAQPPTTARAPDPCARGPENSRPFRALAVWMALQAAGAEGLRAAVAAELDAARRLRETVATTPGLRLGPQDLATVILRAESGAALPAEGPARDAWHAALPARLRAAGLAWPSATWLDGRCWLRACFAQGQAARESTLPESLPTAVAAWAAGGFRP